MRTKKYLFIILAVVIIGLVAVMCNSRLEHGEASQPISTMQGVDTVPLLITQIQKCSKLYTAEYHVHKIVTHDDVVHLKGSLLKRDFDIKMPVGDRKVAIPIDAQLKAYIDFSTFSEENIERQGKKITIVLPDPQVTMTSSKVDQKNVKEYVSLMRAHFSDAELADFQKRYQEKYRIDLEKKTRKRPLGIETSLDADFVSYLADQKNKKEITIDSLSPFSKTVSLIIKDEDVYLQEESSRHY